jgi:hypothetical protein
MSRKFFNGISSINFNGEHVSFSLEDSFSRQGKMIKEEVGTFITDFETFSGVVDFLVEQEKKIKLTLHKELKDSGMTSQVTEDEHASESGTKLGIKLSVTNDSN